MIPLTQEIKPGEVVKVTLKDGVQRHFQFIGYGRDLRRLMRMSVVNLNLDCKMFIGVPVGKVNKLIINGQVIPEHIPFEAISNLEVVNES